MTDVPPVAIAPWPLFEMTENYPLVDKWPVPPEVRLEGDFLLYAPLPRDPAKLRFTSRPTSRLLLEFVALAEAQADQIEAYAKKWGVLGLCKHGFPAGFAYGFHATDSEAVCSRQGRYVLHRGLGGPELFPEAAPAGPKVYFARGVGVPRNEAGAS